MPPPPPDIPPTPPPPPPPQVASVGDAAKSAHRRIARGRAIKFFMARDSNKGGTRSIVFESLVAGSRDETRESLPRLSLVSSSFVYGLLVYFYCPRFSSNSRSPSSRSWRPSRSACSS